MFDLSIELTLWLQSLAGWLTPIMRAFTWLGAENFYLFIMPVFLWSIHYQFGFQLGVLLLLNNSLNSLVKLGLHQPRPYWADSRVQNLTKPELAFGPPSGHSQNAIALFGFMIAKVRRGWFRGLMVFMILMISFSRIYLGVHTIVDVLLGWTIGGLLLWAFLTFEKRIGAWFAQKSFWGKVAWTFAVSLALVLIGALIKASLTDFAVPQAWLDNTFAAHPDDPLHVFSLNGLITGAAAFFGLCVGKFWVDGLGGFSAHKGSFLQRAMRFALGLVGMLVFWMGLDLVFPGGEDLVGYTLRFVRYALVGWWAAGLAPLLFIRLGIGERE